MKNRAFAKKAAGIFALCLFIISPAPLALILQKFPVLPKAVCEVLEGIGVLNLFALYTIQHFFLAIVLRSAIKKAAAFGKAGAFLPVIPCVFGALSCISVAAHALSLSPFGWCVYIAIFALFYFAAIALELFAPRWGFKHELREIIFILLVFLLAFAAVPLAQYVLNNTSTDAFGLGFALMVFTVYPVLFLSAGLYIGAKQCKCFWLHIIEAAIFSVYAFIKGLGFEVLLFAAVYAAIGAVAHLIVYRGETEKMAKESQRED